MIQKYFADIRAKIDAYNHIIEEHLVVKSLILIVFWVKWKELF
jgi:hypothetical protein